LLNVLRPFEGEAATGSAVATIVGHASMATRRRDGYRCAPPILWAIASCAGDRLIWDQTMEAAVTAIPQQRLRLISEFQKFRLPTDPNQSTDSHRPVPERGVAQRHQRGAGCGGRGQCAWRNVLQRTAKSCGS